jgi:hypothetical protein
METFFVDKRKRFWMWIKKKEKEKKKNGMECPRANLEGLYEKKKSKLLRLRGMLARPKKDSLLTPG